MTYAMIQTSKRQGTTASFGRRATAQFNNWVEPTAAPQASFEAAGSLGVVGFVIALGRAAAAHPGR
jgi:hypothetical protein